MKCTECGTKCVRVEQVGLTEQYECPSCCNVFTRHINPNHARNRAALVKRLLGAMPPLTTFEEREAYARGLLRPATRMNLETRLGHVLSDETMADLVSAVRLRPLASEAQVCAAAFDRRRSA